MDVRGAGGGPAVPSAIFVVARAVYAPIYWLGIPYIRTAIWAIGVGAMGWIAVVTLRA